MEKTRRGAKEGSAEAPPRQKSPINFTPLLRMWPFSFTTTVTGVDIKARWAPVASRPLAQPPQTVADAHVSALFTRAGTSSAEWRAHSLVTPVSAWSKTGQSLVGRGVEPPFEETCRTL